LGSQSGLRVSEAISFDLSLKKKQNIYLIEGKRHKKRAVYVSPSVIKELKKHNWKPNQTNRFNFYHFLKKIKRELNISKEIELSPHTLRRTFTTYHAENGLSLPILSKMLGHVSVRTTALYWQNIYQEPDNEVSPILAGKKWLENQRPPNSPITENFLETLEVPKPVFIDSKPVISHKNPTGEDNSLSLPKTLKKTPGMLINEISPRTSEKFSLNPANKKNDQLETNQLLVLSPKNRERMTEKEEILLVKIKLLEKQLKQTQTERDNLKQLVQQEKELSAKQKQRADQAEQKLQEIKQQLNKEDKELEAKVEQPLLFKRPITIKRYLKISYNNK
jgi:hypothetical protein